ncbi:hypothetical protein [Povalibacter sp.]|uniref:hypothetical protein n=1 Tax=Povalibacter sp. TaxID=1962978 RepID=UPI002F40AEFB
MPALAPDRIPVIVGCGEITDGPPDLSAAREPLALMEEAVRRAAADATADRAASLIDSLDIVAQYSWPYADTCSLLTQRLGHRPRHCEYGTVGGESRADDTASLALLTNLDRSPIGHPGIVSPGDDGLLTWKAA